MESEESRQTKRKEHPQASANFFSILTLSWLLPIFWRGMKQEMTLADLPAPLDEHAASNLAQRIQREWDKEVTRAKRKNRRPSLLSVLVRIFWRNILFCGFILQFSELILRSILPLILGSFIKYFKQRDDDPQKMSKETAYLYAVGLVACSGLASLLWHPYNAECFHIGMKLRVATTSLIYKYALQLKKTDFKHTSLGEVVSLITNDVNRFDLCVVYINFLWVGPLQAIIGCFIAWYMMGPISLIGIASFILFSPIQVWLGKRVSAHRLSTAAKSEERIGIMNEIISGIQVIKMYTWEKPISLLVESIRKKETKELKKSLHLKTTLLSVLIFHSRFAIFLTTVIYALLGNSLNAEKVFVLICIFDTLRTSFAMFISTSITQVGEALSSVKRIEAFLIKNLKAVRSVQLYDTMDEYAIANMCFEPDNGMTIEPANPETVKFRINLKNVTAKWSEESNENTLTDVSAVIDSGVLTAVIGPVGSGKTSLLYAILGDLPLVSGFVDVNGQISYACQEPWLFEGSVRQNILFNAPYYDERYKQVVKVCSLERDFQMLPFGDISIVGERGVTLSGGQRARVNLARAVYREADIYLFDDPFSAVDTAVGKHIFESVKEFLKNKTVLIVSHQLQYLENVDQILLLENGALTFIGDYKMLRRSVANFASLIKVEENSERNPDEISEILTSINTSLSSTKVPNFIRHIAFTKIVSKCPTLCNFKDSGGVNEDMKKGSVRSKVYKEYLTSGGGYSFMSVTILMFVLANALGSCGDYWLTNWVILEEQHFSIHNNSWLSMNTNGAKNNSLPMTSAPNNISVPMTMVTSQINFFSRNDCIYVYTGLVIGTISIALFASYIFCLLCIKSSNKLHNNMFACIMRAKMWFFNKNSSGRILNRFSTDMNYIDETIPVTMMDVMQILIILQAVIIMVTIIKPALLMPTCIILIIFHVLRKCYLSTARNIKRLEHVARSPILNHLNASLQGLVTIRACRAEKILVQEFSKHQDLHSSAFYIQKLSNNVLCLWLDMVCSMYTALVTFSFLLLAKGLGGNVGLAISQALELSGLLQWGVRQSAELENSMTSVERVLEYSGLESEPQLESPLGEEPEDSWPEFGNIQFCNVCLRYSSNEPWVLKNICFSISDQQKVGIVGRTGAGKSSLISALFRLSEISGKIIIDGIETGSIGLRDVRSKISIIPQEPFLFSGSLRKNLDPFDNYTDDVLWNALEEVQMSKTVKELPNGLQAEIREGGSNLSTGQKQLICLARAIVRNNKILVLDEATANIDAQTDLLIQKTIRQKFAKCTVLTVAHRLNTVIDSDKIIVMDNGLIVEFDHPHILLQNENGFFYNMVQKAGKGTAQSLMKVAQKSYENQSYEREELKNSNENITLY